MSQPPADPRRLSDAEVEALVERVAARAAREAVDDVFRSLGLDVHDPSDVVSWHADRQWTRSAREGSGKLVLSVKTTIFGSIATAILLLIWSTIQIGHTPPGGG